MHLLMCRNKSVIFCDYDACWSLWHLHTIMSTDLNKRLSSMAPVNADSTSSYMTYLPTAYEIVERALKRIHILRPTSTISLATTPMALPVYHRSRMPEEEIGMLMVDSLSAWGSPRSSLRSRPQSRTLGNTPVILTRPRSTQTPYEANSHWRTTLRFRLKGHHYSTLEQHSKRLKRTKNARSCLSTQSCPR